MDGHIRNNPSWMQFVRLLHCRTREAVLWGKREEEAMLLASGEDGQGDCREILRAEATWNCVGPADEHEQNSRLSTIRGGHPISPLIDVSAYHPLPTDHHLLFTPSSPSDKPVLQEILSFFSSLSQSQMVQKVCVIGAGIIGLSSAVCIQDHVPNVEVTLIAEHFSPNVVSDVAAGYIQPYLCPKSSEDLILKWCKETIDHIKVYMKECPNGGAQEMSGYVFQGDDSTTPFWSKIMPNFRRLSSAEVKEKHPIPQKAGFFFTTYYLHPTKHIVYLMSKFKSRGGKCIQKKITGLADVGDEWNAVVNCTGLGARSLLNDMNLYPVRGQIIRVRASQVKHFFVDDEFYVLLRLVCLPLFNRNFSDDTVILGGTKEEHQWDLEVDEKTADRILVGNRRNVPALEDLEIVSHAVGLRPYRKTIRLEREEIQFERRRIAVIHNYGHGGSGVTLCWGCALDVAQLVKKELPSSKL